MAKMGRPPKIDRQLLHEMLWNTRVRGNFMAYSQTELAEEFGITQATMSLIFKELSEEGRVKRMKHKWLVYDPEPFKWDSGKLF